MNCASLPQSFIILPAISSDYRVDDLHRNRVASKHFCACLNSILFPFAVHSLFSFLLSSFGLSMVVRARRSTRSECSVKLVGRHEPGIREEPGTFVFERADFAAEYASSILSPFQRSKLQPRSPRHWRFYMRHRKKSLEGAKRFFKISFENALLKYSIFRIQYTRENLLMKWDTIL